MQYGDLASTPDCEKDSLLGLTAPMQNLFQIFEITVFLESPFIYRVIMPAIDTPKEFKNSNACRNSPRPSINFKQLLACSPESPQELMKS